MKAKFLFRVILGLSFISSHLYPALAYVTNAGNNTLSVINVSLNRVIATIPVGFFPTWIKASPDGAFVYVPSFSEGSVYAINTNTNTLQNTIAIPQGAKPTAVDVSPSGKVYIASFSNETISVIDPLSELLNTTIPIGSIFPVNLAITPNGARAYVINVVGSRNVEVIDLVTNTVITTIDSGNQSFGVAITPDGSRVYVTNTRQNTVSVISTATNTVTASIALAENSFPRGIAITPNGDFAYVVKQGTSSLAVIDTALNRVTTTIPLTSNSDPYNISITPDGLLAYVTQTANNTVSIIDIAKNTVFGTIPVGIFPFDVTIVRVR